MNRSVHAVYTSLQKTKIDRVEATLPTKVLNHPQYLSKLAQIETKVQSQNIRIDNLEMKWALYNNTIQSLNDSLMRLNSYIEMHGGHLTKLEPDNSYIQNNSLKLRELESKIDFATNYIQETNSSVNDLDKRIKDLELEFDFISNSSESITYLRNLGKRIVVLETRALNIQNNSNRIHELELTDRKHNDSITKGNNRMVDLEAMNNSNMITELESNFLSVRLHLTMQNNTLTKLGKSINEQEAITSFIRENCSYTYTTLTDLETKITSFGSVTQRYNTTVTDLENRLNALETNTSVYYNSEQTGLESSMRSVTSVLQDFNFTLIDYSKRIIELETNASISSNVINEIDSNINWAKHIFQKNNISLIALDDRITYMESQNSLLHSNSDVIAKVDSDLVYVTSVIQDHDVYILDIDDRITAMEGKTNTEPSSAIILSLRLHAYQ